MGRLLPFEFVCNRPGMSTAVFLFTRYTAFINETGALIDVDPKTAIAMHTQAVSVTAMTAHQAAAASERRTSLASRINTSDARIVGWFRQYTNCPGSNTASWRVPTTFSSSTPVFLHAIVVDEDTSPSTAAPSSVGGAAAVQDSISVRFVSGVSGVFRVMTADGTAPADGQSTWTVSSSTAPAVGSAATDEPVLIPSDAAAFISDTSMSSESGGSGLSTTTLHLLLAASIPSFVLLLVLLFLWWLLCWKRRRQAARQRAGDITDAANRIQMQEEKPSEVYQAPSASHDMIDLQLHQHPVTRPQDVVKIPFVPHASPSSQIML